MDPLLVRLKAIATAQVMYYLSNCTFQNILCGQLVHSLLTIRSNNTLYSRLALVWTLVDQLAIGNQFIRL